MLAAIFQFGDVVPSLHNSWLNLMLQWVKVNPCYFFFTILLCSMRNCARPRAMTHWKKLKDVQNEAFSVCSKGIFEPNANFQTRRASILQTNRHRRCRWRQNRARSLDRKKKPVIFCSRAQLSRATSTVILTVYTIILHSFCIDNVQNSHRIHIKKFLNNFFQNFQ